MTDWSGIYTGTPLTRWNDWRVREANTDYRYFFAKPFWGIYDSWHEYDILQAMTKYEVQRDVKVIGQDNGGEYSTPVLDYSELIGAIKTSFSPGTIVSKGEIKSLLRAQGMQGGDRIMNRMLKDAGFGQNSEGYILPS